MNRNNFWNSTIIFGFGFLLTRAVSFLLLPIHTNIVNPNTMGYVFIFITFLAFMNAFYSFGMDSALLKYFNKNDKILFTSLISTLIFSIPISLLLYLSSDYLQYILFKEPISIESKILFNYHWIWISIGILTFDAISSRLMTLCRLLQLSWYYVFIAAINVIASIGLNIYFLYYRAASIQFDSIVFSMIIVSFIQLIFLIPIFLYHTKIWQFDLNALKKMFKFAWPFFPATIFFIIIELVDRIMIENLLSTQDVGLYGSGYKIGALMLMIIRAFNINWQPYYLDIGAKSENDLINNFSHIGNIILIILIIITGIISSIWPFLIQFKINSFSIIGSDFISGGVVIPYILIAYCFYGLFILQMPSIYLKNKQNWAPLIWGSGAVINIVSNILLLPVLGFIGAGVSTILAYFSMSAFLIYKNYKWMWIPYNYKRILFVIVLSSLQYALIKITNIHFSLIILIYLTIMGAILKNTYQEHKLI